MTPISHPNEHARVREAYLRMAEQALYRPAAPSDALRHPTRTQQDQTHPQQLEDEATEYANKYIDEENGAKFSIGVSDFRTNRALVYTIEAARQLCATNSKTASALLEMAIAEISQGKS